MALNLGNYVPDAGGTRRGRGRVLIRCPGLASGPTCPTEAARSTAGTRRAGRVDAAAVQLPPQFLDFDRHVLDRLIALLRIFFQTAPHDLLQFRRRGGVEVADGRRRLANDLV